jgi:NADH dehydrogenase [ubiquinone] 1 alpha subcomplex assembly factor 5
MLACKPEKCESFINAMAAEFAIFDRKVLAARRNRAAAATDFPDFLLARVADDFDERLSIVRRKFSLALNLGAHHGLIGRRLRGLRSVGSVIEADMSPACLAHCEGWRVLADEEALPFADDTFDLVVAPLTLHHVNDLPGTLLQIRRALKPDGLFLGAMLGGVTLHELRSAWLAAEAEVSGGVSPRVAPFADVRDAGALLQRAGFALPVVDSDKVVARYESPIAVMKELKAMGASNVLAARRRVPVTTALLAKAAEAYMDDFADNDARVPATFEILTMTAWAPHDSQQKPLKPGSAKARLADALGVSETPVPRDPDGTPD